MIRIREKQMIKVTDMVASPRNVRTGPRTHIEELADQIFSQSLLHAPTVVPKTTGKGKKARTVYETDAGERRRQAMLLLIEQGRWPKDTQIEANIAEVEEGVELSLSENLGTQPMHPADAFIAFRTLIEAEGKSAADVAAHFGIEEITVKRRMKLANVAPELLTAYREGEIDTNQIMALAVVDDHEAQLRVWNMAPSWQRDPANLRAALTRQECSTVLDPVAAWVGADAYEQSGGALRRDLFSESGEAFIDDRELLDRIAADKLQERLAEVKAEGWGWVEVRVRMSSDSLSEFNRCPTEQREPTEQEAEQMATLEQRIDQISDELQALYDSDEEEDGDQEKAEALERESEACDEQLQTLRAGLLTWNDDMMAHAGAIITIAKERNAEARVVVHRGLVVPEDREALNEVAVAAGLQPVPATDRIGAHLSVQRPKVAAPKPEYSEALMRKLTAHRTAALQAVIANSPQVATALLVEKLVSEWCSSYYCERSSCLKVSASNSQFGLSAAADDIKASKAWTQLEQRKDAWTQRLAEARGDDRTLLQALLTLPLFDLHELLALCVALTLDTVQSRHEAGAADALARVVGLDMADWWAPTADGFLNLVPKAKLVEAVKEAVSADAAMPLGGLKKAQAVGEAERLLQGTRWLPAPLRAAPFELQAQTEADDPVADAEGGSAEPAAVESDLKDQPAEAEAATA